tara:strand:+ start:466 stop:759 length:294 start_codon:yes stop_codon:yes gene_type:complete
MGERINIDVGGFIYSSTIETLNTSPALKNLIAAHKEYEDDSIPFIDRDGLAFTFILNFMRVGQIIQTVQDPLYVKFLINEATFYGIDDMVEVLRCML